VFEISKEFFSMVKKSEKRCEFFGGYLGICWVVLNRFTGSAWSIALGKWL
jgi:hypothetical protein